MAEAHNSAQLYGNKDEVVHLKKLLSRDEDFVSSKLKIRVYQLRSWIYRQVYNWQVDLHNAVFPQHWMSYLVSLAGPPMLMLNDAPRNNQIIGSVRSGMWRFANAIPVGRFVGSLGVKWDRNVRVTLTTLVSGTTMFMALVYTRRYTIRALLSYTGWLYEGRNVSLKTKIWGVMLSIVLGRSPILNSYSTSLPRLPVPALEKTVARYLESVEGPLDATQKAEISALAKGFLANEGPRLQRFLRAKSWLAENYVSDWWEKYVYLMSRGSLMINSNYYVCDIAYITPTNNQVSRAAVLMYGAIRFKTMLERETLPPIIMRGLVPLCMKQYERLFSSTRIPGDEMDEIKKFRPDESKHVVVMVNGSYFVLYLYTRLGAPLQAFEIEIQLQKIVEDSKLLKPSDREGRIPSLTGWERSKWAKIRSAFFRYGVNKQSLDWIERAMFFVVLDSDSPATLHDMGKLGLHGTGYNRWFDKSFTLMVYANGKAGLNGEHAWADAPILGHMWEYCLFVENVEGWYNSQGRCVVPMKTACRNLPRPLSLAWSMTALPLRDAIDDACAFTAKECADLHLYISEFNVFGKDEIKKCKISPDGFVQQALQLAFYRMHGFTPQTYESSMTRMYQAGRTETVRSATPESTAFIRAMIKDIGTREDKVKLLHKATAKHQLISREAMTGQGCDRHLFALYVTSKGIGTESKFLEKALGAQWTLSTSQQPQTQCNGMWDESMTHAYNSPGGGFGPVSDDGYGVSYLVVDRYIFFHVSSKYSNADTDSEKLSMAIAKALEDIRDICELSIEK
eukprot:CFRG5903T1